MELSRLTRVLPLTLFSVAVILPIVFMFNRTGAYIAVTGIGAYWTYKSTILLIYGMKGFRNVKRFEQNATVLTGQSVTHLIALACYGESYEILKNSINSILLSAQDIENYLIVISFEERRFLVDNLYQTYEKQVQEDFEELIGTNIVTTRHPQGLSGEVPGAAANKSWAVKKGLEILTQKGMSLHNTVVTIPDADTVLSPSYLNELSNRFQSDEAPGVFYQTVSYNLVYNQQSARIFTRTLDTILTASILSSSHWFGKTRYAFSCFSISAQNLEKAAFWDTTTPIDDTPFYWRYATYLRSPITCIPLYSRVSVCGIYDKSLVRNIRLQFQQYYRWEWGTFTTNMAIKAIYSYNHVSVLKKISEILRLFDRFIGVKILSILISIGFIAQSMYPTEMWSTIVSINSILLIGLLLFKMALEIQENKRNNVIIHLIQMILEVPVMAITLSFFGIAPFIKSAYDMARGKNITTSILWSEKI